MGPSVISAPPPAVAQTLCSFLMSAWFSLASCNNDSCPGWNQGLTPLCVSSTHLLTPGGGAEQSSFLLGLGACLRAEPHWPQLTLCPRPTTSSFSSSEFQSGEKSGKGTTAWPSPPIMITASPSLNASGTGYLSGHLQENQLKVRRHSALFTNLQAAEAAVACQQLPRLSLSIS